MLDRDEIIRRIISGDMSRGGAGFAAKMAAARMGTPDKVYSDYFMPTQADLDQRFRDAQVAPMMAPSFPVAPKAPPPDIGVILPGAQDAPMPTPQTGLTEPMLDRPPLIDSGVPLPPGVEAPGLWSAIVGDAPGASNAGVLLEEGVITPEEYLQLTRGSRAQQDAVLANAARRKIGAEAQPTAVESPSMVGLLGDNVPAADPNVPSAPGFEFMSGGIGMPEDMPVADMNSLMFPAATGPTGTPLASPQAGLPTPPGPMTLPAVTPPGGGGGIAGGAGGTGTVDLANLPSAADVSPLNPEAYNPETGTRPPEARALSIWDRMFGEVGSDQRAAASQGLIRMGAAMMQSKGDLGQALGEGIEAGLLEFDATTKALADEAKEAKQMGMEEEAHELNMALKRLQLARAQSGGGGGGGGARTSGVVENPFESKASDYAAWSALLDTDPRFAGLNPEVKNRIALNQSGFITAGSIMSGQNPDPLAAYLE